MKNDEKRDGLPQNEHARAGEHAGRGPLKRCYVKPDLMEFGNVTALTRGGAGSFPDAQAMLRMTGNN